MASKCLEYQFLATLYERGQGIPSDGDKRGGRKGCWCDQNYYIKKGDSTVSGWEQGNNFEVILHVHPH